MRANAMRKLRGAAMFATLTILVGCAAAPLADEPSMLVASKTGHESCKMLGSVTAEADCACYDKLSYDRVRGAASRNLELKARAQYPDSDLIEVSGVNLYLNNAVAHGIAYKCGDVKI